MSFSLLKAWVDIKVFIDYDEMLNFLIEHGTPKDKLPDNRKGAGSCIASLIASKKIIVIWIDAQWSSGLYIQATVAHEGFHALQRIWGTMGVRNPINEEIQAQALTSVYIEIAKQLKELGVDFNKPKPDFPSPEKD